MGVLRQMFAGRPAPGPAIELPEKLIADADACHRAGADVGGCTGGVGPMTEVTVAGTPMRQEALAFVANKPRQGAPDGYLPAVVMREPTNEYDKNAIRVLVDGVMVGYMFKDKARAWNPVLREVEKRGQVLTGAVRLHGGGAEPLGAAVRLRDSLPNYAGPITKAKKEKAAVVKAADAAPHLLDGDEWLEVGRELLRLSKQDSVRTKQAAGLAVKNFRTLLPQLWGHANALRAATTDVVVEFVDLLAAAEDAAEELLDELEDADEREDFHDAFIGALDDLTEELRRHGGT